MGLCPYVLSARPPPPQYNGEQMLPEGPQPGGLPAGAGDGFQDPVSEHGAASTAMLPLTRNFCVLPGALLGPRGSSLLTPPQLSKGNAVSLRWKGKRERSGHCRWESGQT